MKQVGRFAPSATGRLHLGSLLAALVSYLHARAQGGAWCLRIDDVDSLRVVEGAADQIVETLSAFGLRWDGPILRQRARGAAYADAIDRLKAAGLAFDCGCTRREARQGPEGLEGPIYPGTCRDGLPPGREPRSVRFRVDDSPVVEIVDRLQGVIHQTLSIDIGDFVIRRADGITAYQLATVVDDAYQQVTEVVRGVDLLSSTPRQHALYRGLHIPAPRYLHHPLLVDASGEKLGKSQGALALEPRNLGAQIWRCLVWLGQEPPDRLHDAAPRRILSWAEDNWSTSSLPEGRVLAVIERTCR